MHSINLNAWDRTISPLIATAAKAAAILTVDRGTRFMRDRTSEAVNGTSGNLRHILRCSGGVLSRANICTKRRLIDTAKP